jgi:hypothetical protein
MKNEILARLVSLGYATYQRVTVGLSSHCIIKPQPGLIIAVTNIQVLPYVNLIQAGLPEDTNNVYYTQEVASQSVFTVQLQELEGKTSTQLRIIQDGSTISNYALRGRIEYDTQFQNASLGETWSYQRKVSIVEQEFDCLFYARKQLQFSFVGLGANGDTIGTVTEPFNTTFNNDLSLNYGMNGTAGDVNQFTGLLQGPPTQLYFPYTQSLTANPPAINAGDVINDYLIYPYGGGGAGGPFYEGSGVAGFQYAAAFNNLPLLNVEFVTFNAGNDTSKGFFSPQILDALGWK